MGSEMCIRDSATTALDRTEEFYALSQFVLTDDARTLYFYWRPLADQATGVQVALNVAGTTTSVTLASDIDATTGGVLPVAVTSQQAANIHRNNPNNVRVQLTNADGDVLNAWVHSVEPSAPVPRAPRIILAAIDVSSGAANLGVASITLPADLSLIHI